MKTKNFTRITLFLIGLLFIVIGCKKADDQEKSETVTDIDGNVYQTVTIGTQVWLAENLKTTHYQNGEEIPNVTDKTKWINLTSGALCDYNNSQNSTVKFGKLYNWLAVSDSRKIAPVGWRISTNEDWETLISYLGGENKAGGKLKETGVLNWISPNVGATNSTGFTALPCGGRGDYGDYFGIGEVSNWWTTDNPPQLSDYNSCSFYLYSNEESLETTFADRYYGFSVRCVKD